MFSLCAVSVPSRLDPALQILSSTFSPQCSEVDPLLKCQLQVMKTLSGFLEERRVVMTVQHVLFVIMIMACVAVPRHQINCLFPLNVSVLFLQMNRPCAEISFAHNSTGFLSEENG